MLSDPNNLSNADVALVAAEVRCKVLSLVDALCETANGLQQRWDSGAVPTCHAGEFRGFLNQVTALGNALAPLGDVLRTVVHEYSPALGLQPLIDHRGPEGRLERFADLLRANLAQQTTAVAGVDGLERRLREALAPWQSGRGVSVDLVAGMAELLLLTMAAIRSSHTATAEPLGRLLTVVDTLLAEPTGTEDPR